MNPLAVKAYGALLGLALAAAGLPVGPDGVVSRAVVSSGHQGAVRDIAADAARGLLLSAGDDGTLRVWDIGSQTLIRRLAVARQGLQAIAVDPAAPLAAVLISEDARAFRIDVWNWETRELRYRIELEAAPLFVHFSLSGSFLLCGAMTWDSLRIYRATTGERVPADVEGGMVGFAEVSRSNATLMTYRVSGRITYQDLASGTVARQVPAPADLVDVRPSPDRRYLVGHTDTEILCVDALSGETRARVPAAQVVSLDVSGPADRLAWITSDGSVHRWDSAHAAGAPVAADGTVNGVVSLERAATGLEGTPRTVRFDGDDLILGGSRGEVVRVSPAGEVTAMARDILSHTTGVAVTDTGLVVASGAVVRAFQTLPRLTELFTLPSPFSGEPAGLLALDDGRVLAWKQGEQPGALGVIDCRQGTYAPLAVAFDGPLAAVAARGSSVFTLERSGSIHGIDLATGAVFFQATRPGAVCLAPFGADALLVGSGQTGPLRASLVRIDLRTGETAPVPGTETFTYALCPDPGDGALYSLAVDGDGVTKLFRHEGTGLERESVVDENEDDLTASVSRDPATDVLYSSLGRQRVTAWSRGSLRTIGAPSPGITSLQARNGLLASAQRDSTVSLWDTIADRPVATLYPFSDGSWAAIFADGSVGGAPSGLAKVSYFAQGRLAEPAASPPSQEAPVAR